MRWVLYGLGAVGILLVVAVVVLKVLSSREGAGVLKRSVEINKPPQLVFRWISEPDRLKQWISWLLEVRQLDGPQSGVGARRVFVMDDQNNKRVMELQSEVKELERDRRLVITQSMEGAFTGV